LKRYSSNRVKALFAVPGEALAFFACRFLHDDDKVAPLLTLRRRDRKVHLVKIVDVPVAETMRDTMRRAACVTWIFIGRKLMVSIPLGQARKCAVGALLLVVH